MRWHDQLFGCPSECFAYRKVDGVWYAFYLRWRCADPWTGYVVADCRLRVDLADREWSENLLAGTFYRHGQVVDAKRALVRLAAARLGVDVSAITGKRQPVLSGPQVAQIARFQPRR
jgi:hypothetical protein